VSQDRDEIIVIGRNLFSEKLKFVRVYITLEIHIIWHNLKAWSIPGPGICGAQRRM
jgi:hypothetical protein